MTTIYLARHGEYRNDKNILPLRLPGIWLTEAGKKQAGKIARYLAQKKISAIYSSLLLRTRQTAQIIGEHLNLKPRFSRLIIEVKSPLVQGMGRDEFFSRTKEIYEDPAHLESGGETLEELCDRMNRLVRKIRERHRGQNILIVTHGDPAMALIAFLVDKDVRTFLKRTRRYIPIGGLVKFEFKGDKLHRYKEIFYEETPV